MRKFIQQCVRGREGATALEFALVSPIVLAVVFAIIEFGRAMFTIGVLNYAAAEATRFATVNFSATTSEIQDVAEDSFILIDPSEISNFSVTAPLDPADQTRLVTVEIAYNYEFALPYIDLGAITLTGDSKGFLTED
jgi:Flp pilus assembly pilin Flp